MKMRPVVVIALALALVLAPGPAAVADTGATNQTQESTGSQAGLGALSIGATIVYGFAKIGYAAIGGATGGMAWMLTGGDTDVAGKIFTPSMRGTYVLTPRHITGEEPIHFVGSSNYNSTGTASNEEEPSNQSRRNGKVEEEQF